MVPNTICDTDTNSEQCTEPSPWQRIAIIGMAGRFPKANNVSELWDRLIREESCLTQLAEDELRAAGVPSADLDNPNYVRVAAPIEDYDRFDASFFGITPREAELMDPQQRIFLECCWEGLEDAGYDPRGCAMPVGVFAGARTNTYLMNILSHPGLYEAVGAFHLGLGNDLAFLTTRISHLLNLHGPSVAVHTACSTSLVAVHLACASLRQRECDMALAGAVAVNVPHRVGYLHEEGSVQSPDGLCRTFDAAARGTLFGSGVAVVVLKRLSDALRDHDAIYSVILSSALNNDGAEKASFTAPSVKGQVSVIREALRMAAVSADTIGYVECHGTGTLLGDAIEARALVKAFGNGAPGSCAIGSVKTNLGHLDAVAGMTGLIKTALALKNHVLPASLHYSRPNPQIRLDGTKFYVNTKTTPWISLNAPLRAGVSAFGVGGTNAHAILEEPPIGDPDPNYAETAHLFPLSARHAGGLHRARLRLSDHLRRHSELDLSDLAFTLQEGRHHFAVRYAIVAKTKGELIDALEDSTLSPVADRDETDLVPPQVTFLFPGQGSQYPGMGSDLYETEPVFRNAMRECSDLLQPLLCLDLVDSLYQDPGRRTSGFLNETYIIQPALLSVEYSIAQLLTSWGIQPESVLGHSLGEYPAAVVAKVMTLEEALRLVAIRGQLMQASEAGGMLAVAHSVEKLRSILPEDTAIAAVNAPDLCTVAGPAAAILQFESKLEASGIACQPIQTSRAFHCSLVEPAMSPFLAEVRKVPLRAPQVPFLSSVSGTWIQPEEVQDPEYWCRQMRLPVRFDRALAELLFDDRRILLDVGPGQTLRRLALRQSGSRRRKSAIYAAMPSTPAHNERETGLKVLGRLWEAGAPLNWKSIHHATGKRVSLPTYPFERTRYWIDRRSEPMHGSLESSSSIADGHVEKIAEVANWFWTPSWRQLPLPASSSSASVWVIIFNGNKMLGEALAAMLERFGHTVIRVLPGDKFESGDRVYRLHSLTPEHYTQLFETVASSGLDLHYVLHLGGLDQADGYRQDDAAVPGNHVVDPTVLQSLYCMQGLATRRSDLLIRVAFLTTGLAALEENELLQPEKSAVLAIAKTAEDECTHIQTKIIDVGVDESVRNERFLHRLIEELENETPHRFIAYRGKSRWVRDFEHIALGIPPLTSMDTETADSFLIIGGLGTVGLMIADHLSRSRHVNLILMTRTGLPERSEWQNILKTQAQSILAHRIRSILSIEEAGARVEIVVGDLTSRAQVSEAFDYCLQHFGNLAGVIHAAGGTRGPAAFCPILRLTESHLEEQQGEKLSGLRFLAEAIQNREIPLVLCISSNSSIVGGLGFAAYASSSCAMNLFVEARARSESYTRWISASWDHWPEASDISPVGELTEFYSDFTESALLDALELKHRFAMTKSEVQTALEFIFSSPVDGHLIVSTGNLIGRLSPVETVFPSASDTEAAVSDSPSKGITRPHLKNAYVAPGTDLEKTLVSIWRQHLGIESVGIHDDFFELGGNSLLATRLVASIRKNLNIGLPLVKLFERPTVAQMAAVISEQTRTLDHTST